MNNISRYENWSKSKLLIGQYPELVNTRFDKTKYDIIINVSDEFYANIDDVRLSNEPRRYWFPLNECTSDMGINSIFAALKILYLAETMNESVYLHCHAGVNRSKTVAQAYHYMRTGHHIEQVLSNEFDKMFIDTVKQKAKRLKFINIFVQNCGKHLPNLSQMETFLKSAGTGFEDGEHVSLDRVKIVAGIK